ncbi:MAG: rod shape-determining protein MreD [Candidatus Marinimicrobia bacterium]|nr:rod shape-determining protein MreD [Candidatus Neomarinimicrobiota bacterium]
MLETKQNRSFIAYIVMSILFIISIIFNDFISIVGVRPDILLIMLLFFAFNERPIIVIIAAFCFGLLQDIFLPGSLQYWGLAPLFKTLIIYILLKLLPFIERLRGFYFLASVFSTILIYYIFYNLLYYSGYVKPLITFYRYSLPETAYTFLILLVLNMIFPLHNKNR